MADQPDGIAAIVKVSAIAEVRDLHGNLISSEPVAAEFPVTQEELEQLTGEQD